MTRQIRAESLLADCKKSMNKESIRFNSKGTRYTLYNDTTPQLSFEMLCITAALSKLSVHYQISLHVLLQTKITTCAHSESLAKSPSSQFFSQHHTLLTAADTVPTLSLILPLITSYIPPFRFFMRTF